MDEMIQRLRDAHAKATPGDWYESDDPTWVGTVFAKIKGYTRGTMVVEASGNPDDNPEVEANARFVIAAHNAMPALLDRLSAAEARAKELEEVVERLPVTKDGVPITPGMTVWCLRTARWKWVGERGTSSYRGVEDFTDYTEPQEVTVAHLGALGSALQRFGVVRHCMSFTEMSLPEYCYSTREAAAAAARAEKDGDRNG